MKTLRLILTGTAAFIFTAAAHAQTAPGAKPAGGAPPAGAPAKAKHFSPAETHAYIVTAEAMQFQLKASEKLRWKMKDGDPEVVTFAGKISREMTELYTPGVSMAQEHGVPGNPDKKPKSGTIPNDINAADRAALAKMDSTSGKDDKKWTLAMFELLAKESKKNAAAVEKALPAVQDADLKSFLEKTGALLKSESAEAEAKFQELRKKK